MDFRIFKPKNPKLRSAIQHFWTLRTPDAFPPVVYRLLPGVNKNLVFDLDFDGRIDTPSPIPSSFGLLSAECDKLLMYTIRKKLNLMGIMFHPGALFPLFRIRADELQGFLDLDLMKKGFVQPLMDQILEQDSVENKLIALERELLRIFDFGQDIAFPIRHAMEHLCSSKYTLDEYCRVSGLGRRRVERQFNRLLGLSPKNFQKAARIRKAVRLMIMDKNYRFAHLANTCGYYDQSHFNHEFMTFTGMSPGRFIDSMNTAPLGLKQSHLFSSDYTDPRTRNTVVLIN